jgi:hypothetical protein
MLLGIILPRVPSEHCELHAQWTQHHVPEGLNLHLLFTLHVDPVQEHFKTQKMGHNLDDACIHT